VMTTSLGPTWLKSLCQNGVRYYVDTTCAWKPEADCLGQVRLALFSSSAQGSQRRMAA
jgi:hypothetical protein